MISYWIGPTSIWSVNHTTLILSYISQDVIPFKINLPDSIYNNLDQVFNRWKSLGFKQYTTLDELIAEHFEEFL